ncbi:hypothetical protein RJ639_034776 [Escallonia herrerae]|uniref:Uncharacterized protein n=1 Tax=Escallonia herrerae TaxID=1293975 RepID=A0AA88WWL3_9ASTE|nr:hypothetical protein RJ639_034776 [Escallonia herrerae]
MATHWAHKVDHLSGQQVRRGQVGSPWTPSMTAKLLRQYHLGAHQRWPAGLDAPVAHLTPNSSGSPNHVHDAEDVYLRELDTNIAYGHGILNGGEPTSNPGNLRRHSAKSAWWNDGNNAPHLDNIDQGESEDESTAQPKHQDLAGVKDLHGLDKVMEGGAVVLTLKDQSILADGDINPEVDTLENVENW